MKHEEKLAFWINVHNALVMHAFLVYGIPQNNLKRVSLLLKAAYNVGGHAISVDMMQRSILGCRLPRPGQWLRLLFSMKTKFKVGDARKAYAIEHPEPLLHFALCSGSHSDPAVRVYTSKRVFEELETAKHEYIQSTFLVHKEQKILLPKIVESFAKDTGLCSADLMEMIEHFMPDFQRKSNQPFQHKRTWKGIEWIPHNFTFRYLLSKEVAWWSLYTDKAYELTTLWLVCSFDVFRHGQHEEFWTKMNHDYASSRNALFLSRMMIKCAQGWAWVIQKNAGHERALIEKNIRCALVS